MRSNATWLAAGALALAAFGATQRAAAIEVPRLVGPVNDHAGMLSADEQRALGDRLESYRQQTGHQFALLTVPSLEGQPIEDYGIKVAEQWKLGSEKGDEGLILIVVPKDRRARIEVGYGLEGTVTDAVSARVIREVLGPALAQGQNAAGIQTAFDSLMRAASGEAPPAAAQPQKARRRDTAGKLSPIVLPLLLFGLFAFLGSGRRGRRRRGLWGGPFIIGGGGGGWGGGGFGGGGGGGWSGGGGGFGGGGASGEW